MHIIHDKEKNSRSSEQTDETTAVRHAGQSLAAKSMISQASFLVSIQPANPLLVLYCSYVLWRIRIKMGRKMSRSAVGMVKLNTVFIDVGSIRDEDFYHTRIT